MRIILEDGFAIQKGGGIGRYTEKLFSYLKELPEIDSIERLGKLKLRSIPSGFLRRIVYILWLNIPFQFYLRRNRIDLVHFTNFLIPLLRLSRAKYVVTIHDLTAWRFPETLPRVYLYYLKWVISYSVNKADLILTITNSVKEEIIERFKVSEQKVKTLYVGIDEEFYRLTRETLSNRFAQLQKKFSIKSDFLLFVGTIGKRKNVLTLIKALSILKEVEDLQLVLVGSPGNGYGEIYAYLERNNLKDRVIFTGYVSNDELITLYNSARIFVFPSLYEGFGMPLLEAMACGVPIVASKIPSTEEIAKDIVVYYSPPQDEKALAQAILQLLRDKNRQRVLVAKGLEYVKEFAWRRIAESYLKVYKEALENRLL